VSDFVYPAYFDMFRLKKGKQAAQYDHLKNRSSACSQILMAAIQTFMRKARSERQMGIGEKEKVTSCRTDRRLSIRSESSQEHHRSRSK